MTFICSVVDYQPFTRLGGGYVQFVAITAFMCTGIVYLIHLFKMTPKVTDKIPFKFTVSSLNSESVMTFSFTFLFTRGSYSCSCIHVQNWLGMLSKIPLLSACIIQPCRVACMHSINSHRFTIWKCRSAGCWNKIFQLNTWDADRDINSLNSMSHVWLQFH